MIQDGTLLRHAGASMQRVILGVLLGSGAGIAIGALLALWKRFEDLSAYVFEALRTVSPIAMISLFVIWFGAGDLSKVLLIAFTGLFPIALATQHGMQGVDKDLVSMFRAIGASRMEILFRCRIPSALPFIINGARVVMTVAWYVLIVTEMVGGRSGLGLLVLQSNQRFATEQMWVGIIGIALLGLVVDSALARAESRVKWGGVQGAASRVRSPDWRFGVVGLVAFLVGWELLLRTNLVAPDQVAAPTEIWLTLAHLWTSGELATHVGASMSILARALVFGLGLGLLAGIATGSSRAIDELLRPVKGAVRNINPLALFPIAILLFGIGDASKIFIVAFGGFFPVWLQTHVAVRGIPRDLSLLLHSLGAGRWERARLLVAPAALPTILNAFRISTGFGFIAVVGAELISSNEGLGWLIRTARQNVQIAELFAGVIVISVLGISANYAWQGLRWAVTDGRIAIGRERSRRLHARTAVAGSPTGARSGSEASSVSSSDE